MSVTPIKGNLSVREQAELEVRTELAQAAVLKMKRLLKDKIAAQQVLAGIEVQITDLERQIEDGSA